MKLLLPLLAAILPPLHAAPWFDGADLSALDRIEELGGTFRDDMGQPTNALAALASAGTNCVRLRLFVAPDGREFTHNDLPRTLAMAKRAKAAKQAILLDFREVLVVEAGFSWNEGTTGRKSNGQQFAWPKTPEGQASFLRDVCQVIHETTGGRGIGVLWWHPDSIPVKGANVWMGGSCALWRTDGSPLPALGEFAKL